MGSSRRVAAVLGDQAVFAVGNYLLVFAALRIGSPQGASLVAVTLAVYAVCCTVAQAVVSDVVIVRPLPGRVVESWGWLLLLMCVVAHAVAFLLLVALGHAIHESLIGASAVACGLAQFTTRSILLARSPRFACISDGIWTASQTLLTVALWASFRANVEGTFLLLAWALPASVSLAMNLARVNGDSHIRPGKRRPKALSQLLAVGAPFGLEATLGQLTGQLAIFVLAVDMSAAPAEFRAGQVLFGPTLLVIAGLRPLLIRTPRGSPLLSIRYFGPGWLLGLSIVFYGGLFAIAVPDSIGESLAGQSWPVVERLVVPLSIDTAQAVIIAILFYGMRSRGERAVALRAASFAVCAIFIGACIVLTDSLDPTYIAWAMAAAAPVHIVLWSLGARRSDRHTLEVQPSPTGEATEPAQRE